MEGSEGTAMARDGRGLDMAARVRWGTYGELVPTIEKEGEGTGGTHCFLTLTQSLVGARRVDETA